MFYAKYIISNKEIYYAIVHSRVNKKIKWEKIKKLEKKDKYHE